MSASCVTLLSGDVIYYVVEMLRFMPLSKDELKAVVFGSGPMQVAVRAHKPLEHPTDYRYDKYILR